MNMKPHVIMVGFDPRKAVNSVSYICSECHSHITPTDEKTGQMLDKVVCADCEKELACGFDIEWQIPKDIAEAMGKQKPMKLVRPLKFSMIEPYVVCPKCGYQSQLLLTYNYCPMCGQKVEKGSRYE